VKQLSTIILVIFFLASFAFAQERVFVQGRVLDAHGAPIENARVTLTRGNEKFTTKTSSQGEFVIATTLGEGELRVEAEGFAVKTTSWSRATPAQFAIVLEVASLGATVTVTPTRTEAPLDETAASVSIITQSELSTTAASRIDDALRQVPGFSLFRRTGSRAANPTTQGVSLRGVGASGASRAIVLFDGLSLNDPFGGWVYWSRVPRESVGQVEVLRGGASYAYGSGALGGVVNILSDRSRKNFFSFEGSYGNQQTPNASLYGGLTKDRWSVTLASEIFHTDGYILVDPDERGPVDTRAGSRSLVNDLTIARELNGGRRLFVRGSLFGESRTNGTPLQINRTYVRNLSVGADLNQFTLRAYTSTQTYDQTFTAVTINRTSETLTRVQRVPAQSIGFSGQWSRAFGPRHNVVAGVEGREVRGASDETAYVQGQPSSLIGAGGKERTLGLFGVDVFRVTSELFVTGGLRVDRWREFAAHSTTRPIRPVSNPVTQLFSDRTETAVSPQFSILYRPSDFASFSASFMRAFRQPTLNELYRSFRVGDVLTLANEKLAAERLTGGETSANLRWLKGKLLTRGTFFWTEMTRPVANVTLTVTPTLITRQRQNLGRTRSRGVELEVESEPVRNLNISGAYMFVSAKVLQLSLPQVPRHQFTIQARYSPRYYAFGMQARGASNQFDDDQNVFRLGKYSTIDAFVSRKLKHGVEVFATAENLFNQNYAVGRTPITTIGAPRLVRIGLRFSAPLR
jgi:outer membrane receptor protein involved in Fe transport